MPALHSPTKRAKVFVSNSPQALSKPKKVNKQRKKREQTPLHDFEDPGLPADFGFYDTHLDERFVLKKVFYQPTLIDDLESIADNALGLYLNAHGALPPIEGAFPTPEKRKEASEQFNFEGIVSESCIQRIFHLTTAKHCSAVAATLELQLPCWPTNNEYLSWSIEPEHGIQQAKADGFLKLANKVDNLNNPIAQSYSRTRGHFPNGIGIWEVKGLKAGSKSLFEAILALSKEAEFPWVSCIKKEWCKFNSCGRSLEKNENGIPSVWAKVGPDAKIPFCTECPIEFKSDCVSTAKARKIVQQVWSEMVITDTTFASLHAGIYEMIFKRNRGTNALYVSSIIRTSMPKYFKRQTGLMIAMLRDAKQRSLQIEQDLPPPTWCDDRPTQFLAGPDTDTTPEKLLEKINSRKWVVFRSDPEVPFTGPFFTGVLYDRIDPSSLSLHDSLALPSAPTYDGSQGHFTATALPEALTSQGSLFVDEVKFLGCPKLISMPLEYVFSKHATYGLKSRQRLQREAVVYSQLTSSGAQDHIPLVLGLFRHANIEKDPTKSNGNWLTLLLEDTGIPLAELTPQVRVKVVFGKAKENPDEEMKRAEHSLLDQILTEAVINLKRTATEAEKNGILFDDGP
ncbi:hypothetical protein H0H93_010485 [Arthromyces matolae]|nr:hypothetical protein H0H93_010485 [Arthromyces matolae]